MIVNGSDATTTCYMVDKINEDINVKNSAFIDNDVVGGINTFAPFDSLTIDFDSVEVDNYVLKSAQLTETTGAGANIAVDYVRLVMSVKNGTVKITGAVQFDISNATSVVKLQDLPTKALDSGTFGPPNAWLTVANVTTSGIGNKCLISSPAGVSGSLPTSIWISYNDTAYNTGWPVGTNYQVPIDIEYRTEMRGWRTFN